MMKRQGEIVLTTNIIIALCNGPISFDTSEHSHNYFRTLYTIVISLVKQQTLKINSTFHSNTIVRVAVRSLYRRYC